MQRENDLGLLLIVLRIHKNEIAGRKRFQKIVTRSFNHLTQL
jgi:hypothetical protein